MILIEFKDDGEINLTLDGEVVLVKGEFNYTELHRTKLVVFINNLVRVKEGK